MATHHHGHGHDGNKGSNDRLQLQQQQHLLQQDHDHQFPYRMMQQSSSSSSPIPPSFNISSNKDGGNNLKGSYDLGELDQALFLYLDGHQDHHHNNTSLHQDHHRRDTDQSTGMRPPPTLNIFPAQPMYAVDPQGPSSTTSKTSRGGGGLVSSPSGSKRPSQPIMELANPGNHDNNIKTNPLPSASAADPSAKPIKREANRKGPTSSSEHEGPKTPDPKTLRRLAQNREAARKSRLRKKAYVQQLESSRIKLNQLEQELQRARNQGMFFGDQGLPVNVGNISSDAAVFDMEYARWLEEHHRLMCELRAAVQEHLPENELRLFVDNCVAHYDEIMNLKSMVVKSDVFHIVSGMWKTPAERCFMWIGGFRPSELIKVILGQIEPLTEQQILGICGVQQSTQEAEEALSQGLEGLNQSLSDTIASESLSCPPNIMGNYMNQMALAMNKLSAMEGFVRQADNLRHQTIHRLHQILTTRQAARCLLAITEYFHRLRALSSLWMSRPRE